MSDPQLPLIELESETLPEVDPPPAGDIYMVAAYNRLYGYWTVRKDVFNTRAAVERYARKLSAQWTHRTILHVRLECL